MKIATATLVFAIFLTCSMPGLAQRIAGGREHSLVVCGDSTVWGWGRNNTGFLGDGTNTNRSTPVQVRGAGNVGFLKGVVAVVGGEYYSVALKSDGTVWTWGQNSYGLHGDGNTTMNTIRTSPGQVRGPGNVGFLTGIIAIAGIGHHCVALKNDGTVWTWGNNGYGQLGDTTLPTGNLNNIGSALPVQVMGPNGVGYLNNVVAIQASYASSTALKSDGTVWTWGHNGNGALGIGNQTDSRTPVQVVGLNNTGFLTGVRAITNGGDNCMALLSDSSVVSWGFNNTGLCGDGTGFLRTSPVRVLGPFGAGFLTNVKSIFASLTNNYAVQYDGTVLAWGPNSDGQIGDSTTVTRRFPVKVKGPNNVGFFTGAKEISGGLFYSLLLKDDGSIWNWGNNSSLYFLGDGTTVDKWVPQQVAVCAALFVRDSILQNTTCSGPCDGRVTVKVITGSSPFRFNWSNGDTTQTISNLCNGVYQVTVIDATNNTATASVTLGTAPGSFAGTVSADKDSICAGQSVQLTNTGSTGSVQWQSATGTGSFSNINAATGLTYNSPNLISNTLFRVVVTNGACSDTSASKKIVVNPLPVPPVLSADKDTICASDSAMIQTSPGAYASYSWNNGDTRNFTYAKFAGGFWVTVTDGNGCSAVSNRVNMAVYPVPSVSIIVQGDTLSSFGAVSYQWYYNGSAISGATAPVYVARQSGAYSVAITDANGCRAVSTPTNVGVNGIANMADGNFRISPNPVANYLIIQSTEVHQKIQSIRVYDMLGRLMATDNKNYMDVSQLPAGAYCVIISTEQGDYQQRIIKQ